HPVFQKEYRSHPGSFQRIDKSSCLNHESYHSRRPKNRYCWKKVVMISKDSKLRSVIFQKCPHCHKGDMFKHGALSLRFADMHKTCPACGFDFVQEPSFYFGAMYFSYAIQVAVFVFVYLVLRFTIDPDTWTYV